MLSGTAADDQGFAGDPREIVARQEDGGAGDVLRHAPLVLLAGSSLELFLVPKSGWF